MNAYDRYRDMLLTRPLRLEHAENIADAAAADATLTREQREALMLLFFKRAYFDEKDALRAFTLWKDGQTAAPLDAA